MDRFCWLGLKAHRLNAWINWWGGVRKHEPQKISPPQRCQRVTQWEYKVAVSPTVPQTACSHMEHFELCSPISKRLFLVPRTTLLNLCRLKVPNGEPRICRNWPIASSNVSPFGSVSLACGFGIVRSLWPLGRNAFMDAWTWTLCWIRQYLCFLLCLHRPIRKARCHV